MRQAKKLIATLAFLLVTPTLGAKSEREKPAASSPASRVVYRGTGLGKTAKDNFRVVIPGQLYRSNKLQPGLLSRYITRKGLKTVINLIGEQPQEEWWQQEALICRRQGAHLYNIPLHTHEYTPPEYLEELLGIFDSAQSPLMIHCELGVDRTGVVVGLWLFEKGGATRKQTLNQLSFLRYGHHGAKHPQMRSFLKLWVALRNRYDRAFALREYRAIYEDLNLEKVTKLKLGNKLLKDRIGYIDQIRYNLDKGRYRPRSLTHKWRMKLSPPQQPVSEVPVRPASGQPVAQY